MSEHMFGAFAFSGVIVAILIAVLFIASLVWVYGDAESRGKSGCLVALFVFLFSWPLSLLLWLVFRPEYGRRGRPY